MAAIFLPSCNNSITYTRSITRLKDYLLENGYIDRVSGCCKQGSSNYSEIPPNSDLVVICNSCSIIAEESLRAKSVTNALEIILNDTSFNYPDYGGEQITIQDCWRARGKHH